MSIFQVTYVDPGTKLWLVVKSYGRHKSHYRGDIIVPVVVEEVDDIYSNIDNPEGMACWRYRYADGTDYVSVPTDEKDEQGWPIYEKKDPSCLGQAKPVNQFVWIDEPVGHGIQVGDKYDGLYLTLHEAQRHARPSKKKHLKRRLQAYRAGHERFIASTWEVNGDEHPGFHKLPNKKIYVRKK
jgi:hypothetical protein